MSEQRRINLDDTPREIQEMLIIDCSSSMSWVKNQTLQGINDYIRRIKEDETRTGIPARVSLIFFNHEVKVIFIDRPTSDLVEIASSDYVTSGNTALNDALGVGLLQLEKALGDRYVDVTVTVYTDGQENSSTDYPGRVNQELQNLKNRLEKDKNWTINLVGAGNESQVVAMAANLGIDHTNTLSYSASAAGTLESFDLMREARTAKLCASLSGDKSTKGYFSAVKKPK